MKIFKLDNWKIITYHSFCSRSSSYEQEQVFKGALKNIRLNILSGVSFLKSSWKFFKFWKEAFSFLGNSDYYYSQTFEIWYYNLIAELHFLCYHSNYIFLSRVYGKLRFNNRMWFTFWLSQKKLTGQNSSYWNFTQVAPVSI